MQKTQERLLNHFHWPGIYGDVKRYIRSCDQCQKNSCKPTKVPLSSMPVIGKPFQRVAIDIIGPLCKSSRGNRFVLTAIHVASKYPDAVALNFHEYF